MHLLTSVMDPSDDRVVRVIHPHGVVTPVDLLRKPEGNFGTQLEFGREKGF